MAQFHRVSTDQLVRGAARILVANANTVAKPTKLGDVIELTTTGQTNEVQTITLTGTGLGGTFTLSFKDMTSVPLAPTASAAQIQAALEPLLGSGNVVTAGGPLGTAGVTVTFQGALAYRNQPMLVLNTGTLTGTVTTGTVVETTKGTGQYEAKAGWTDLGGTRDGIQITVNNSEDAFDIDQVAGDIGAAPTAWECSVATRLAEMTLEKLQLAWEGSAITTDTTPTTGPEKEVGFAGATNYTMRRLAVLFQKPDGKVRGYLFHKVVRSPQEGTIDHRKGGEAQSIAMTFRVLADETVADPLKQFFIIRDQV